MLGVGKQKSIPTTWHGVGLFDVTHSGRTDEQRNFPQRTQRMHLFSAQRQRIYCIHDIRRILSTCQTRLRLQSPWTTSRTSSLSHHTPPVSQRHQCTHALAMHTTFGLRDETLQSQDASTFGLAPAIARAYPHALRLEMPIRRGGTSGSRG
jgi:hypothetical protein